MTLAEGALEANAYKNQFGGVKERLDKLNTSIEEHTQLEREEMNARYVGRERA